MLERDGHAGVGGHGLLMRRASLPSVMQFGPPRAKRGPDLERVVRFPPSSTRPAQVAVDLLTGPGRNPGEAVALMDWMERNERALRR